MGRGEPSRPPRDIFFNIHGGEIAGDRGGIESGPVSASPSRCRDLCVTAEILFSFSLLWSRLRRHADKACRKISQRRVSEAS
jgi:hypothetical protein